MGSALRVLITLGYALALGAVLALNNFNPGMSSVPAVAVWALGLPIGFAVGRWWVVLAVAGIVAGLPIGYDPAENDANPAFWWPRLLAYLGGVGLPLLLGWAARIAISERRRHRDRYSAS